MSKIVVDSRQVFASLAASESDIMKAVAKSVTENIDAMELDVKSNAPKAGDNAAKITGGYKVVDYNISSYTYKVYGNGGADVEFGITGEAADLAAYIEFGTGTDAAGYVPTLSVPFQRQAYQFYKNGKGTLIHNPFFIPAWLRVKDKIITDAQKNLNDIKL